MAPHQEHLTISIREVLERVADLRCLNCPAILASETVREELGHTVCRHIFTPMTIRDDNEQGCKKGPVSDNTFIFGVE